MGYKLRREVRDAIPPGLLSAGERLLVLELADICGDDTREGWPGISKLATLTDMSDRSIQQTLARVGKKWVELRVPLGKNADGKTYYAFAGRRTTYRFPPLARLDGAMDECPSGATDEGPSDRDGATDRSEWCDRSASEVRQMSDPSPQGTALKNNTSQSLSAADHERPAPNVPAQRTEREEGEASPKTKSNKPTDRTALLLDAGLTPDETQSFTDWADLLPGGPKGGGWYRTVAGNGDLTALIERFRADSPAAMCPECHGEGETGDYLNRRLCGCLWFTDPERIRKDFVKQLDAFPKCEHGINGGDIKALNGWQLCSLCRGPGWVDVNHQGRTDSEAGFKPSTSASRARQALSVADELDRQYGHGRYAASRHKPWRPLADESEYDRPFSGQRRASNQHIPYRDPPAEAYKNSRI